MTGDGGDRTGGRLRAAVPRGAGEKVRVFIGSEPKTEIARKVLESSIRRRTSADVEFTVMIGPRWEYDTKGITVGTGFSLRRFMIPEYCGWAGRAIYLDSDQVVFGDILDLWEAADRDPLAGRSTWTTYQKDKYNPTPAPQTAVMVIDCAAAQPEGGWHLDRVMALLKGATRETYARYMHCETAASRPDARQWWTAKPPGRLPTEWNHLNVYEPGKTQLLHYTKEPEQPWYKPDHPYAVLWQQELQVALGRGEVTAAEVRDACARFGVKEDWRTTNGLHPDYLKFLTKVAPPALPKAQAMRPGAKPGGQPKRK